VLEVMLRDRDAYGAIGLDYGLRTAAHLPFARDIARWQGHGVAVALHVGHVRGDASYDGARAQDAFFDRLGERVKDVVVLAVGHDALVREVRARFEAAGGDPERVLHNY
jgi:NAD(P)H-flavin reductase